MDTYYVYADGEVYSEPPSWKSDDYFVVDGSTTLQELVDRLGAKQAVQVFRDIVGE